MNIAILVFRYHIIIETRIKICIYNNLLSFTGGVAVVGRKK